MKYPKKKEYLDEYPRDFDPMIHDPLKRSDFGFGKDGQSEWKKHNLRLAIIKDKFIRQNLTKSDRYYLKQSLEASAIRFKKELAFYRKVRKQDREFDGKVRQIIEEDYKL